MNYVENGTFVTKDWNEAALLLAHNISFQGMRRDGSVCFFQFSDHEQASVLMESFWKGDLLSNSRQLIDAQRRIKDLIHRDGNGKNKHRQTGHL
jgi:hypothetical protein